MECHKTRREREPLPGIVYTSALLAFNQKHKERREQAGEP